MGAEEALAIGVFCAFKAGVGFAAGVRLAVNHSGDSDSTGSIAGNLLGVMLGVDAIPGTWLDRLEAREIIEELAADMIRVLDFDSEGVPDAFYDRYPPN